jgi:hypothetical protein
MLRNAAKNQVSDPGATMRTHDHQVDLLILLDRRQLDAHARVVTGERVSEILRYAGSSKR